jgi:phosphoglucomutase
MYKEEYNKWLEFVSPEDKEILLNMSEEEIKDSFTGKLSFGTAGIRGIMGLGTNRLNIYNIGMIMKGYAEYLNNMNHSPGVIIGYDTRNNSYKFANECALVLNAYGVRTYMFNDIASTPLVSYAVHLANIPNIMGGIVITSSHNEYIYNGLKIYNLFGAQLSPDETADLVPYIEDVTDYKSVKKAPQNNELMGYLDEIVYDNFDKENEEVFINKDLLNEYGKDLRITYTSLHGTGINVVPNILEKYNIKYNLVGEQCVIDPMFTYAPKPNPEILDVWNLPIEYAKKNNSDVIIATDPDSDRIGIMYKVNDNYELLNGNMTGIIFLYYLINNSDYYKKHVVRSYVTTDLVDKICKEHRIKVIEVLTGCKNIAKVKIHDPSYLFGFEESLGYMFYIGVNDKNAFSSINMLLEILCYLKKNNMALNDYINEIFTKYGYYSFKTIDIKPKDKDRFMIKLSTEDLIKCEYKKDYLKDEELQSNALKFVINDNEYIMIRPSGTENKIKVYYFVSDSSKELADKRLNSLINMTTEIFDKISK